MKIKDKCGIWVDDHQMIADKFFLDYHQQFKSSYPLRRTLPDPDLPTLVTVSYNDTLIRLPNLEEVRLALFGINSFKTLGLDGFGVGFFKTY